jgi:hypothetical protein
LHFTFLAYLLGKLFPIYCLLGHHLHLNHGLLHYLLPLNIAHIPHDIFKCPLPFSFNFLICSPILCQFSVFLLHANVYMPLMGSKFHILLLFISLHSFVSLHSSMCHNSSFFLHIRHITISAPQTPTFHHIILFVSSLEHIFMWSPFPRYDSYKCFVITYEI